MANLRTNNLSGEGGRNAYRGSVFFDGRDDVTGLQVIAAASNDDFTLGTGDFALEMWIFTGVSQSATLYDGRRGSASDVTPHIDLSSNVVRYLVAGTARITGSSTLSLNSWHHISVERASGSTKLYVNGVQEGSTYSDSNSYVAKLNRPMIGAADGYNSVFDGYISNVRLCKGHTVYGAAFTPPTSELTAHTESVLLCCQDSDDPLQEATGKEMLGQGGTYSGRRYSNLATNGDLETGDTTNWVTGGLGTFEVSTDHPHSGSYSLHCISNSNGDACAYVIPVTLDTEKRYKISAYIKVVGPGGTSARAKMKIGSGVGGNENYESRTAGQAYSGLGNWTYVEWIGLATSDTTHVTFNESSANDVNDYYVDDLRIELWYPEENVNILANPNFYSTATGWSFTSTPSGEFSIANNKLSVADNSRTNDAIASQTLFAYSIAEGRYKVTVDYSTSSGDFDLGIGNSRLFGVANTYNGGAGTTSSFTGFIEAGSGNSSFRLVCNQHNVGEFYNITLSRVAEPKAPKIIPPYGTDAGNTFNGAISMNSPSWMYFPTGRTEERGRGRGIIAGGGQSPSPYYIQTIDFISIQSTGNAIQFGTLSHFNKGAGSTLGNETRAVSGGGFGTPINIGSMEFFEIATQSNTTDFGDLVNQIRNLTSLANSTRGIFAGGTYAPGTPGTHFDTIQFITIASLGDATDFGDMVDGRRDSAALSSPTRGIIAGGNPGTGPQVTDEIDYITIATAGNAQDFGNMTNSEREIGAAASSTRGIIFGGFSSPAFRNTIDFITIATTGNASDFGDLTVARTGPDGCSNKTRAAMCAGSSPTYENLIDFVTLATTGDAADFGDLTSGKTSRSGCTSDSHGGLS
jgi:hypothetical protein